MTVLFTRELHFTSFCDSLNCWWTGLYKINRISTRAITCTLHKPLTILYRVRLSVTYPYGLLRLISFNPLHVVTVARAFSASQLFFSLD